MNSNLAGGAQRERVGLGPFRSHDMTFDRLTRREVEDIHGTRGRRDETIDTTRHESGR